MSALRHGRLELAAAGSWTARHAKALEPLIEAAVAQAPQARAAAIHMGAVEAFDTYGAWLLERLTRTWTESGGAIEVLALPDRYLGLLEEVHRANRTPRAMPPAENRMLLALEGVGRGTAGIGRNLVVFVEMLGAIAHALVGVVRQPQTLRITSVVHHLDRVGWQAVPIMLLITFLIGGIIAQQGFFHFRKFGADDYVVDMVGILVLREIGVLIVAIMVAGRSGSSYTAELGSMKMREEIDALRTMGLDPVDVLILPRVLALVIALPMLTFLGSMAALYGGGLVAWLYGGMSPDIFIGAAQGGDLGHAFRGRHDQGAVHGAGDRHRRLRRRACASRAARSLLGLQTTASVVKSIFLVIVLDGLFAIFFASIGM